MINDGTVRESVDNRLVLIVEGGEVTTSASDAFRAELRYRGIRVVSIGREQPTTAAPTFFRPEWLDANQSVAKLIIDIDEDLIAKRAHSRQALEALVTNERRRPRAARAPRQPRHGYRDAPRLPCYRSVRAR